MKDKTTNEMLKDLDEWGCDFMGCEDEGFSVQSSEGGTTSLENEDYPSAVMEAWTLMKP